LKYRPDALLSGSFLWSDIWREQYGNNDFSDKQDKIFHDVKPKVVCNGDVVFGQLKKYQNKVDIGWGCKDNSTDDFNLNRIVCITPSLNYTEKYTEKFLEIRSEFQNDVDFSFNINHTDNSMFVIRPGLGMITTCVSHRIPIVALWDEDDSIEIQHLAHKVEELGIGISLNVKDDFILPTDVTKFRESFKKLNLNGYLKFAGLINV